MIRTIVSYCLSFILLLSVLYIPVHTHRCHLFDKTETTLFSAMSCCCTDAEGEIIDTKCCSSSVKVYASDHESIAGHSSINVTPPAQWLATIVMPQDKYHEVNYDSDIDARPPPVQSSGRFKLIQHQVFRI
ncbi:MAG: hypothetical protein ABJG41_13560 [Cyclobacteriaceae bacterium]